MIKHLLCIFAFIIVSFGIQGASHFSINTAHYAGIDFMRSAPIMPMGFAAMIMQGLIMSLALSRLAPSNATIKDGVIVSLAFGAFLAAYIVLAAPAKYAVPSIASWIAVEGIVSLIQFSIYGVLLGIIHQKFAR